MAYACTPASLKKTMNYTRIWYGLLIALVLVSPVAYFNKGRAGKVAGFVGLALWLVMLAMWIAAERPHLLSR